MSSKFLNISTDNTLGGSSASDEIVSSQKAIKEYVDSHGGSVTTDGVTINTNADDEIQAIGVIEKNAGTVKYDWIGTSAEHTAQNVATLHPTWVCYITDDETPSNFANVDASNFTSTGKSTLAGFTMPSDTYTDLALQASGTTYTAPANGYYYLRMIATTNANCGFQMNSGILGINEEVFQSGAHTGGIIPVKTGDSVGISYWNSNVEAFRFVYAEGEL